MADMTNQMDEDISVAPGGDVSDSGGNERPAVLSADAGADESIEERLRRDPENKQARLDRGLDESMDASDPPATTQPVHSNEPPKSSGYDEAAEASRQKDA